MLLVTWVLSGLLAVCGALCFAELAAAIPETGGTYTFLKRAFPGTPASFLFGWMMCFTYATGAIAVVAAMHRCTRVRCLDASCRRDRGASGWWPPD